MSNTTENEGFPAQPGEAPSEQEPEVNEADQPVAESDDKPKAKRGKAKKADTDK